MREFAARAVVIAAAVDFAAAVAFAAAPAFLVEERGDGGEVSPLVCAAKLVAGSAITFGSLGAGVAVAVAPLGYGRQCRLCASSASDLTARMYSRLHQKLIISWVVGGVRVRGALCRRVGLVEAGGRDISQG